MYQHLETLFWSIKLVLNYIPFVAVKLQIWLQRWFENVNLASLEKNRPT